MNRSSHSAQPQRIWIVFTTLLVASMLAIIPLPDWASAWRPNWVAMTLVYWCLALPERVGVTTAWMAGIILDVLSDTLLGLHAFAFIWVAYVSIKLHTRWRVFPVWQQAGGVFLLCLLCQAWYAWVLGMLGNGPQNLEFLYPSISSMLLWPWLFILLRDIRRNFQVS